MQVLGASWPIIKNDQILKEKSKVVKVDKKFGSSRLPSLLLFSDQRHISIFFSFYFFGDIKYEVHFFRLHKCDLPIG